MKKMIFVILCFIPLLSSAKNSASQMGPYELNCDYYAMAQSGHIMKELHFENEWSSTIPLSGQIDQKFNNYHFKIVKGDEGTEFLVIQNLKSKKVAATQISIPSNLKDETSFNLLFSFAMPNFNDSGFYAASAGIHCSIEKFNI